MRTARTFPFLFFLFILATLPLVSYGQGTEYFEYAEGLNVTGTEPPTSFGGRLACYKNIVVVGAHEYNDSYGQAKLMVFDEKGVSPSVSIISNPSPNNTNRYEYFGSSQLFLPALSSTDEDFLAIGEWGYHSQGYGAVHLFNFDGEYLDSIIGGTSNSLLGSSLADMGSVQGARWLVIGAPLAEVTDLTDGRVFVYDLATKTSVLSFSGANEEKFGFALAVLDLDGDGVKDLVVGTPERVIGGDLVGGFEVIFSKDFLTNPNATSYSIDGRVAHIKAGYDFAAVGDVDGDNVTDLLVAAVTDLSGNATGKAYLLSGGLINNNCREGTGACTLEALTLCEAKYSNASQYFGWNVAALGDVDGDSNPEFAVSDIGVRVEIDGTSVGARGLVKLYRYTPANYGGECELLDQELVGLRSGDGLLGTYNFGQAVSGKGCDLDQNGINDLVVSARNNKGQVSNRVGDINFFYGIPLDFSPVITPPPPSVEFSSTNSKKVTIRMPELNLDANTSTDPYIAAKKKKTERLVYKLKLRGKPTSKKGKIVKKRRSLRNEVTFKRLKPGTYHVRYRVVKKQGAKTIAKTKLSPKTSFTVKTSG